MSLARCLPISFLLAFSGQEHSAPPELKVGRPVVGEIRETDPEVRTEALDRVSPGVVVRGQRFRLQVEAGGVYRVELRSWFFNAYLVLRQEKDEADLRVIDYKPAGQQRIARDAIDLLHAHVRLYIYEF